VEAMRQAGTGGVGSVVVALETAKWVASESNPVEKEPTSRPTHARSVRRKRDRGAGKNCVPDPAAEGRGANCLAGERGSSPDPWCTGGPPTGCESPGEMDAMQPENQDRESDEKPRSQKNPPEATPGPDR
jgi:hypothetical protein